MATGNSMFRPIPKGVAIKKNRFTQALVRRVRKITFPIERETISVD
jgi:hypothetical protein